MGSKISPTTIGAFVVGAIVLVIAGVLLFGGGKFFQEKLPFVMFFDSSVEGLNVGAPVIFRGVQIGQVTEISAIADPQTFDVRIRVKIEIVRGVIKVGEEGQRFQDQRQGMEGLIRKGARATLRMQSFVTGLLYVAIDFLPDTPVRLLGLDPTLPELPTIPSEMDQLKSTIQQAMAELRKLPLEAILTEVLAVLKRASTLLDTPELKQALVALRDVMTDTRQLVANADHQVGVAGAQTGGDSGGRLQGAGDLTRDAAGRPEAGARRRRPGGAPGGRGEGDAHERQGDTHGGPQRPGASAEVPGDADRGGDTRAETGRQDPGRHDRLDGPGFRRAQ